MNFIHQVGEQLWHPLSHLSTAPVLSAPFLAKAPTVEKPSQTTQEKADVCPFASTTDFSNDPNAKIQPDDSSTAAFATSNTNPSNLPNSSPGGIGSSPPSKRYLWTISFYAQFFDVDTSTVLTRCRAAIISPYLPPPLSSLPAFQSASSFFDVLDGNPDLYGPFWIATTVVVILFLTGTISHYLATREHDHFAYDFKLLSGAAGLIYGYTGIVPAVVWAVLKWFNRGNNSNNSNNGDTFDVSSSSPSTTALDLTSSYSLYGYSNLIWIPIALLSWSPLNILNYILVALGFLSSVSFLVKNLRYPIKSSVTNQQTAQILLLVLILVHAGLAVAIKVLFFASGSPAKQEEGEG